MSISPETSIAQLPASFWQAAGRGGRGKCPRCGAARLFRKFLKPVDNCPVCAQNFTHQQADDFPAYVAIIISGHVLAPIIILLVTQFELSSPALFAILMPLALGLMLGLLQPAKGAIIAAQWWHGLHGFIKERPLSTESSGPS